MILLTVPRESIDEAKWLALLATGAVFVASCVLVINFDRGAGVTGTPFQYVTNVHWINASTAGFDARFHMGVDGLGITMVFLTTFLFVVATLVSFSVKMRTKEYFILMLILETAALGVFTSLDLILFFLFWELELLPMYLLISVWGTGRKEYSAMKFLL